MKILNILNVIVCLFVLGCAADKPSVKVVDDPKPVEPIQEFEDQYDLVCIDENDEQISCYNDDDCCEGFVCIKDPDGGRQARVCELDR